MPGMPGAPGFGGGGGKKSKGRSGRTAPKGKKSRSGNPAKRALGPSEPTTDGAESPTTPGPLEIPEDIKKLLGGSP